MDQMIQTQFAFEQAADAPEAKIEPAEYCLHRGDALEAYNGWPSPTTIISDGAYGLGGFPGDPRTPETLAAWYAPHVERWSRLASPATTLWFWNTEVGWANVHPLLTQHGWSYEFANVWDKGIAHIAGNVNGNTIRRFPVTTELCVFYTRKLMLPTADGDLYAREWMRYEWQRTGLPFRLANEVCGVKDAATRKYFAQDWLWYFPPPEMMEKLARFANEHGRPEGRPYYSLDGKNPVTSAEWGALRYKWNHRHGLTNVWSCPPLHSQERIKGTGKRSAPRVYQPTKLAAAHLNQKPLELMSRIIEACTLPGDLVWEPFGGMCSATVAAIQLGRRGYAAEVNADFYALAQERLEQAASRKPPLFHAE